MASLYELALGAIALLVCAIMLPMGMANVISASTTGWQSAVVTMWQVLVPVLVMIGVALKFIPRGGGK